MPIKPAKPRNPMERKLVKKKRRAKKPTEKRLTAKLPGKRMKHRKRQRKNRRLPNNSILTLTFCNPCLRNIHIFIIQVYCTVKPVYSDHISVNRGCNYRQVVTYYRSKVL